MNKRKLISLVFALVALLLYRYIQEHYLSKDHQSNPVETKDLSNKKYGSQGNITQTLQANPLTYTKHARCRMECRKIDESEVIEILQEGHVNWTKTDLNDQPCPTYAFEGTTHDRQRVRIVYAGCNNETRVVTAIDLNTDWSCNCH